MSAALDNKSYEIVLHDPDHVKGIAFNMVFMIWRRHTTAAAYQHGMKVVRQLASTHPTGVGVCHVVETDAIPPDAAARAVFVDFLRMREVQHFSVTHEGSGFKAATVRAIVAGVHAFARPTFPHSVHSRVGDAARWHASIQEKLGRKEPGAHIESIAQALRHFHRETYP